MTYAISIKNVFIYVFGDFAFPENHILYYWFFTSATF